MITIFTMDTQWLYSFCLLKIVGGSTMAANVPALWSVKAIQKLLKQQKIMITKEKINQAMQANDYSVNSDECAAYDDGFINGVSFAVDEFKEIAAEFAEQSIIVKQRLQYHFLNSTCEDWNIPENMPFMKEFLNEVLKLTDYYNIFNLKTSEQSDVQTSEQNLDPMGFEVIGFADAKTDDEKMVIAKNHFRQIADLLNDSEREFYRLFNSNTSQP